jgi:hypothetical protein
MVRVKRCAFVRFFTAASPMHRRVPRQRLETLSWSGGQVLDYADGRGEGAVGNYRRRGCD